MPAKRANASATRKPLGLGEGVGGAAAKCQLPRSRRACRGAQERDAIAHQRLIRFAGAIPFDEREFGMMQRAALAIAKHLGEFDDAPLARGQQFFAGEFRRGAQIAGRCACRPARQAWWRRRADEFRCPEKPAARRCRPRQNPARQTRPAARPRSGPAPTGSAGGRHERGGPKRARNGAERPACPCLIDAFDEITSGDAQDRYVAPESRLSTLRKP